MKNILFLFGILCLGGCRKYAEGPATLSGGSPAYLRVFNVVPYTLTPFNSAGTPPFFTFLFDPIADPAGISDSGAIVSDWLGTRQLYCTSYSINEGNSLNASLDTSVKYNINYEYPGAAHVLTAPPINGYDLSAWAQVPAGKHRIQFIARPQTDTPFARLSPAIRKTVTIDTTIDLEPGEVYTLEAVATNADSNLYGAYLRKEQFIHQTFSDSNLYVGFFNLSGAPSAYAADPGSPTYESYPDSLLVTCSYSIFDDITNQGRDPSSISYNYLTLPGLDNTYFTAVNTRMAATTNYMPLPLLPLSYFYDDQGGFRTYRAPIGSASIGNGTLPYVTFYMFPAGADYASAFQSGVGPQLVCDVDPAKINDYPPYDFNSTISTGISNGEHLQLLANLNLLSNVNGTIRAYPCLDILEVVYNTVYMMRIQPAFYNISN